MVIALILFDDRMVCVMQEYECSITGVEALRLPGMYRVKTSCNSVEAEFEMNEKLLRVEGKGRARILVTTDKEKCMEHDFCGWGYVAKIDKLEGKHRIIISLHGPLVLLYMEEKPRSPFKVMNKVYVGISISK